MALAAPLLLALLLGGAAAGQFEQYTNCASCVDAGFGWSFRSGRCGGFANTDCSGGGSSAVATGVELSPLLHDTDMDEKRGDDDDVLALTPLIDVVRKCSDMGEVVDHYSDLPYPPRDPAEERRRIVMDPNNTPIAISHHLYGGTKSFPKVGSNDPPFRILVAGGGTGDATVMFGVSFVAAGLKFEIVHVDLSQASIDIATARVKMHAGVSPHVRFIQGSLLEVASMGLGDFDFINSIGVLHHLSSPQAGLNALTSVLAPDGGMNLMVYGELGRRGIYDFHDMYRLLGERRNPALARKLVSALPDTSWLKKNRNMLTGDFEKFGDSGVTDLLLHHCDHAFRVPEVLHWLENAGLRLVEYCDKDQFNKLPSSFRDAELRRKIGRMNFEKRAAFVELARGDMYKHMFYAARNGSTAGSATEGDKRGEITGSTVMCRYDRFVDIRSALPAEAARRALEEPTKKISYRDELWNTHKDLPAGTTAAILPLLDCKRTVKDLYDTLKTQHDFIQQLGWKSFKEEVTAFYHGLSTHASSRQVFLSTEPFELKPPQRQRDFKKVTFK